MDYALPVRSAYARTDTSHQPQSAFNRKLHLAVQEVSQRCASDKLHHDVSGRVVITGLTEIMNGDHVRMMQHRCCSRFPAKPGECRGVGYELSQQNFHRDVIADMDPMGKIDDAHRSFAKLSDQLIFAVDNVTD